MAEPAVIVEKDGHVLVVTLNRPEKRNAVNCEVMCRLYDAWNQLDRDDELRVAILTGKGTTFCAGMDLSEIGKLSAGKADDEWMERVMNVPLEDRHVPTSAVGSSGLWLGELSARLPFGDRRGNRPSMLSNVPGRDLRTMIWQLAKSQTPRHDPGDERLPAWVDDWHAAYDAGADVTTYEGARL
jgi:hypothetical protein